MGLNLSPKDIMELVASIDLDNDNRISFAEFKAAFKNPYEEVLTYLREHHVLL